MTLIVYEAETDTLPRKVVRVSIRINKSLQGVLESCVAIRPLDGLISGKVIEIREDKIC